MNLVDPEGTVTGHIFTETDISAEVAKLPDELSGLKKKLKKPAACIDKIIHHDLGGPPGDLIFEPRGNPLKGEPGLNIKYKW